MKSALLIIDVQRGLFDDAPHPHDAQHVIERINSLAAKARAAAAPVVFIQHERASGFLECGSTGWQLEPRLVVLEGDVLLRKTTPDSFLRTTLGEQLAAWGAQQVVICGYASEYCVDTTTRRAAALGFAVTLAADAHTTHDKPHAPAALISAHHNATLSALTSFGPRIQAVPSSDIKFDA